MQVQGSFVMKGHWEYESRLVEAEVWFDAIHRPIFGLYRVMTTTPDGYHHHNRAGVSLSWGDDRSDALWRIAVTIWLPHFIVKWIKW